MTDLKELFKSALEEFDAESSAPNSMDKVCKEIIAIERKYFYAEAGTQGKLKEIKKHIISSMEDVK